MMVTTASGSQYEITDNKVRRLGSDPLRRDSEWIDLYWVSTITVGNPIVFIMEPLAEGAVSTTRITTNVIEITEPI